MVSNKSTLLEFRKVLKSSLKKRIMLSHLVYKNWLKKIYIDDLKIGDDVWLCSKGIGDQDNEEYLHEDNEFLNAILEVIDEVKIDYLKYNGFEEED